MPFERLAILVFSSLFLANLVVYHLPEAYVLVFAPLGYLLWRLSSSHWQLVLVSLSLIWGGIDALETRGVEESTLFVGVAAISQLSFWLGALVRRQQELNELKDDHDWRIAARRPRRQREED